MAVVFLSVYFLLWATFVITRHEGKKFSYATAKYFNVSVFVPVLIKDLLLHLAPCIVLVFCLLKQSFLQWRK